MVNRAGVRVCPRMDEDLFRAVGAFEGTQEGHQTSYCQHIWLYRQGYRVSFSLDLQSEGLKVYLRAYGGEEKNLKL